MQKCQSDVNCSILNKSDLSGFPVNIVLVHSKSDTSQSIGLGRIKHKYTFLSRKHWKKMCVCSTTAPHPTTTISLQHKCRNSVIFDNLVKLLKERGCEPVVPFIKHEYWNVFVDVRSTVQSGLLPTTRLKRTLNPLTGLRLFSHFAIKVCIFSVLVAHIQ